MIARDRRIAPCNRTAKPSRGCLPLAYLRAPPAVILSDRRSPSAMCEFPFEWWGCTRHAHPNRQTADRRDGRTGNMCGQRQQTPAHRSCDRALRVPCRRHSPLHISVFRHWQMGKGSSVPFTNHARRVAACSHPNSQQRTRACLSESLRLSSRPSTCVCARHCVRRCRSAVRHLPPPLRAGPAAAAARTTRRECRITAVSRRRLRVRLRVELISRHGEVTVVSDSVRPQ